MVSFDHEILVKLFCSDGKLAVELLRQCHGLEIDVARIEIGSIDLSQVTPTGYRADAVVVVRDHGNRAVAGVIVEVQRREDRDKRLSWPVYVAALRAELGCPAILLVIAPEPKVAAWARQPIELGHPGFRLTPVVIGFDDVPWVRDRTAASRVPELPVLSAMAHPALETAEIAIDALAGLPTSQARLYFDVIMAALPAAIRQRLEARMQGYQYQSDFARKYYGQGLEEGRQEGLQEGRQEGLQEGRQEGLQTGLRAAVIALARTRIALSDEDLAAVEAVSDPHVLTDLVTALGQAQDAMGARAALDHALAR